MIPKFNITVGFTGKLMEDGDYDLFLSDFIPQFTENKQSSNRCIRSKWGSASLN